MRSLAAVLLGALTMAVAGAPDRASAQAQITCGGEYEVVPGDTLGQIAVRGYGRPNRFRELYAVNVDRIGPDINIIEVGTRLRIPCDLSQPVVFDNPASNAETNANFDAAPELASEQAAQAAIPPRPVEIVFNRASAPRFILNVGIIDPLLRDITRVTQGRVTFRDPPVTKRDPREQLALVTSGEVDGAYMFNGHLAETHPLVQITMQPMIGGTALQTAVALWRTHDEHFRDAGDFSEVKLLGFIGAPPAHIWRVSDAPVTENEQLADNNAWAVPYFDGLDTRGANAVRAENAERVRQLESTPGLPPATYALAHGAARAVGIWNRSRTVTEIQGGVYAPTFSVFISKAKWDEISPSDQATIERLAGEALALRSAAWDRFDNGHKAEMLAQGLKIVQPDLDLLAELQDRARLSWEQWIQRADKQGISGYNAINAFFKQMEALRQQYPG